MADVKISAEMAYSNMKGNSPEIIAATEKLLKNKQVGAATKKRIDKDAKFKAFVEKWSIPVVEKATRTGGFGGVGVSGFFKEAFGADSKEAQRASFLVTETAALNALLKAKNLKQYIASPFMRGTGTPRTQKAA